jgi:hypothetical protein
MARVVIQDRGSVLIIGDTVIASALVDGTPVTVYCARADLAKLATKADKIAFIVGLLKAAVPPAPVPVDLAGTYDA